MSTRKNPGQSNALISLVVIGDLGEAYRLRMLAEGLGVTTRLHPIGLPAEFIDILGRDDLLGDIVILSADGDANGFVFGAYAESIDVSMLRNGALSPDVLTNRVGLSGRLIISTACSTGGESFARVFTASGADFIAPDGDPDGDDIGLFVHIFLHMLVRRELTPRLAFDRACQSDPAFSMFRYHVSPA